MNRFQSMDLFRQVAEAGSFAEVSRTFNIASSSISKQVTELEDTLGVRLLDRTTRHVRLTEVGQRYYETCKKLLRDLADNEAAISDYQSAPRGRVSLAAPMSFGVLHLVKLLPEFLRRYPEVDVDLNLNDRFVDVVNESHDLVIRISDFADTSMIARRLAPCRHVICASPDYVARHGVPADFRDLANHVCLNYSNLSVAKEWSVSSEDEKASMRFKGRASANNGEVLRSLAVEGVGIALLPTFIAGEDLKSGRLVPLLPGYGLRELVIYVLYPHHRHVPLKVRALIDYLVEQFGTEPYWD